MRQATLLFLIKRSGNEISEICLAMKRRGFGAGRWNGTGGKVAEGETIEQAAKRETLEEIGVEILNLNKVAELTFTFPHKPEWNQIVHTYFCDSWKCEPKESEEMAPKWFSIPEIPYSHMWPGDDRWLPRVIAGEKIRAKIVFGEKDTILEHNIEPAAY